MVKVPALRTFVFAVLVVTTVWAGAARSAETGPVAAPTITPTAAPAAPKDPSAPGSPATPVVAGAKKTEAKPTPAAKDAQDQKKPKDPEGKDKVAATGGASAAAGESGEPRAKPKAKAKTKHPKGEAGETPPEKIGEGPSPASPPPLTMGGLREEMRREREGGAIDPATPGHTKLEQMLAEVTKARASLHEDAARLEAMLIQDGEGASDSGAGPSKPVAAPDGAKPPGKNPLDILAKALRGIKPEQAAPIVSRLDKRLAATVLQRMPPVDAGKILGAMKADAAAELATQIAMRTPSSGEAKR